MSLLSGQTFHETFAPHNSAENVQQYIDTAYHIDQLRKELNNHHSIFFFAKVDAVKVGYLKINTGQAQTELQDPDAMELERIYVLQSFHGKNIGKLLMEHAISIAKTAGCKYLWLGVWEKNERALRFYQKVGFKVFDRHLFKMGQEVQTDLMMKLELNA